MHGLVALDGADRVLRPAILWNDQRTAAECAEIEETLGLERLLSLTGNRALPGFTAPKLLWLRRHEPEGVRADRADRASQGLRAPAPVRRARDRRRRRFRNAAARRRGSGLERRGAEALWSSIRRGCRRCSRALRCRARRTRACRSPPGRATRRRARSGSVSTALGRCRSRSGRRGSCSPRWSGLRPMTAAGCTRSATRYPVRGTRWA